MSAAAAFEANTPNIAFALDPGNRWPGNFRDLNAMVVRMATLSDGGRITCADVEEEISRVIETHPIARPSSMDEQSHALVARLLGADAAERHDDFDLVQLAHVLAVCRDSTSAADAARKLFAVSFRARTSSNYTDRLSKYLARFGIKFKEIGRLRLETLA